MCGIIVVTTSSTKEGTLVAATAESHDRQRQAHMLRLAGLTWPEIAQSDYQGAPLYDNAANAHRAAKNYAEALQHGDTVAEARATDMARFDALQRAVWRKAIAGDMTAAKLVLQIMTAREKLLGTQNLPAQEVANDPLDELAKKREAS
jgi:hypothetical protein